MGRGPGWERQRWREERGGRTDTPSALGLVSLSTFCPGRWAPGEETEAEGRRADPCASWAQRFSRERVRDPGMTLGLWRGLWLSLLTPLCFASPLSGQLAYSEPILESQPFPLLISSPASHDCTTVPGGDRGRGHPCPRRQMHSALPASPRKLGEAPAPPTV